MLVVRCLRTWSGNLKLNAGRKFSISHTRSLSVKSNIEDWSDFNHVVKELRNISRENGLGGEMPATKLLKDLGYGALVMAIRKKHGGIVEVATKMGTDKNDRVLDVHKKVNARNKRRQKRKERIDKHDFY